MWRARCSHRSINAWGVGSGKGMLLGEDVQKCSWGAVIVRRVGTYIIKQFLNSTTWDYTRISIEPTIPKNFVPAEGVLAGKLASIQDPLCRKD